MMLRAADDNGPSCEIAAEGSQGKGRARRLSVPLTLIGGSAGMSGPGSGPAGPGSCGMSDEEVQDNCLTFLLAGHETTATAMAWALVLLSRHPEARARVLEEIRSALGAARVTAKALKTMPYTQAVIKETLRLYPSAPFTMRVAKEADVLCGYPIPAGTIVTLPPIVLGHHPALWARPEEFVPERFLEPEIDAGRVDHPFKWIPFLAGSRQCIGREFALAEAGCILVTLLHKVQIDLVPDHPFVHGAQGSITLSVQPYLRMLVRPAAPLS
uniref:Cytochrome P450 n=1 Tax=Cryptomonas curvata TaxID=233186 RepID=A0A7S0MGA5_9CRYP